MRSERAPTVSWATSWLARTLGSLARLLPRPANLGPGIKPDVLTLAQRDESQAPIKLQLFDPAPELTGKTLLDLGCGLGGNTAHYAAHGSRRVVGLEISLSRAQVARHFIRQRDLDQVVSIVIGDAARLPFCQDAFDLVMATDTWEHLREPDQALVACHRVTKKGGAIYIYFMPYYSPWGAHVWDWVAIPWLHICLPPRWLLAVIREVDQMYQVNAQRAEPIRLDWHNAQDPAHARRLTVARFERSVRQLDLRVKQLTALPIGFRTRHPIARLIGCLAALPGLRELLTGLVVCVLHKETHNAGGINVHHSS